MRLSITSGSVFTGLAIIGTGVAVMFPDQKWVGAAIVAVGFLALLFDLRLERSHIAVGTAASFGKRLHAMTAQIMMLVGALIFVVGALWTFWPTPPRQVQQAPVPPTAQRAFNADEIRERVAILDKVYAVLDGQAWNAYLAGHQLRNSWSYDIPRIGPKAFSEQLSALNKSFGDSFVAIDLILNGPAQYDDITKLIRGTFTVQGDIYGPIAKLYTDVRRLPEGSSRETALLLSPQGQDFSKAVDLFDKWITDTKRLIAEKRRQELAAMPASSPASDRWTWAPLTPAQAEALYLNLQNGHQQQLMWLAAEQNAQRSRTASIPSSSDWAGPVQSATAVFWQ